MKSKQVIYYGLIVILLIVFLVSGIYVLRYMIDSEQQQSRYDNLAALVEEARSQATEPPVKETTPPPEDGSTEPTAEPTEPPILTEYEALYELNNDLVGWIRIEDTKLNYPVMQTPESVDYYLHRNFDREYNVHGCIYVREVCDVNKPSDNLTIYGHHMKDGSMFGTLSRYNKKSYWEEHDLIQFDTLTERHTYRIFSVFKTTATLGKGFEYHRFVDAVDEEDFNEFIATCKELAFYDTGITPVYGDKIICLSTCEYTLQNGRLVVAAVRIE